MAIPVSDEDVEEAGAQVIARVDVLVAVAIEPLEQRDRIQYLVHAGDALLDPFLEHPQSPGKDRPELLQPRVVGHHEQLRIRLVDAHRVG